MNILTTTIPLRNANADVVVLFLPKDPSVLGRTARQVPSPVSTLFRKAIELGDFTGKAEDVSVLYAGKPLGFKRLLLVGLGARKEATPERLRRAAATAAKRCRALKATSVLFYLPSILSRSDAEATALTEGGMLSLYRFDKYITKKEDDPSPLPETLTIASERPRNAGAVTRAVERARIICESVALARDLGNAPANEIYPETLARAAEESAERNHYHITVLTETEIRELGMGGVLAVSQGSIRPPRFLVLKYGPKEKRPVVLVGKGVCFDSGGISIKPSAGMAEMKMDMSGAAAVIGTFDAVARLKLPVHIVGLIPAVENMPGGNATKPGDIVRHYGGKTSEVENTDAEGRLILADALGYAEQFRPAAVIDLATLTGAVVVALGHVVTGMAGTDERTMDRLRAAGEETYERVWQLPLYEEYDKLIRSDVADVRNLGGRWAGAITAACFLRKFIGELPWVHLDIAGTAILEEASDYAPKGASGVGVRLLTAMLTRWK